LITRVAKKQNQDTCGGQRGKNPSTGKPGQEDGVRRNKNLPGQELYHLLNM